MGRYMRKSKAAAEVAVMEFPATPLGVRTRARALAGAEYLELRSRRLEKVPPAKEAAARRCGGRRKAAAAAAPEEEEVEVSFGENVLELEAMERSTRETTPCSLIRDSETITTPGSTTRHSHSKTHCRVHTPICHNIPSSLEMDEFFTATEQMQQQAFMEKYNFDPANDCPLPGRYEWVKLDC